MRNCVPYGIAISDTGKIGGDLLGIVTSRDIDFCRGERLQQPVTHVMTKSVPSVAPMVKSQLS